MLKFVILLSAVACALGGAIPESTGTLPQLDGRIVGGSFAAISSFPWQVSIQHSGSHICGGSIYSAKVIVTAAHCLESVSASELKVRAGSAYWNSGGTLVAVDSFKTHKKFNPNTMVNDVAVIHLSTPLTFSEKIKAIGLTKDIVSNGTLAVVSGWGTTSSGASSIPNQLKSVNVEIIRRGVCASSDYDYNNDIKETMLCAAAPGKDSCQGDSGGPLVSGDVLVGIVSWGYGCADANYPGVYASVFALHPWILANA